MTSGNDEKRDDATTIRMLDDHCTIQLQEHEKLTETQNSQLSIEFNDLCYFRSNGKAKGKDSKKSILRNVTGRFDSGKLTMIIGPSGAGKTSLLKIVSGERLLNVTGTITVNGVEPNRGTFRKQVCYVPQKFFLLPSLTAKETIYIAARLKLDASQSKQAIKRIVNEIAKKLGLLNCLDTIADKMSGGERKRLSIGVEIITKPSILLLDEPTSGLDSAASNQLINMLHDMAMANCTVVCVIHQSSSQMMTQFDDIMVLGKGRCMYCGPKSEILTIFSSAGFMCPQFYNIAEFVLEVITEQRNGDLDNLYKVSREAYEKQQSKDKTPINDTNSSIVSKYNFEREDSLVLTNNTSQNLSMWQQQKILFLRSFICTKRDSLMTKLRLSMHILTGLLLGIIFYDFGNDAEKVNSNIGCLFYTQMFLYYGNSMPAIQVFPVEAATFLQEHLNNWYSLRSYYSVKVLTDLPMQVLCCTSLFMIVYYMSGQPMEFDRILQGWSVCMLLTILAQTAGIFMGSVFNAEIGIFLIPAFSIPLLIFAGFFLKLGEISIWLRPLGYISFFRYAFEGLMQAVFVGRSKLKCLQIYCYLRSPNAILSMLDMPSVPFYVNLIVLGSWILFLHVLTYAALCWKIYYMKK